MTVLGLAFGSWSQFDLYVSHKLRGSCFKRRSGPGLARMGSVFARSPAAIGGLLSIVMGPFLLLFSKTQSEQFAAVLLAAIGAIYVGFGLQTGTRAQVVAELIVALGFFSAALMGLWVTPWIVPAAYVMHGIWDFAHHKGARLAPVPLWYPPFCAVFDWGAAAVLAVVWGLHG